MTSNSSISSWYFRPVFFVSDADTAVEFYRTKLGFTLDWRHAEGGRTDVCQVSRYGFELILAEDKVRAGNGRVFISLDAAQKNQLDRDILENEIPAVDAYWGMPLIKVSDADLNELLFSFD